MAFKSTIRMSIGVPGSAQTYITVFNAERSDYDVLLVASSSLENRFLKNMPHGWEKTTIKWERHAKWKGVFRSGTEGGYQWSGDARAILKYLANNHGVQAVASLQIWQCQNEESAAGAGDTWRYEKIYESQFDFSSFKDNVQEEMCTVGLLDSELYRLLAAYASTPYNIPFWQQSYDGSWSTDAIAISHQGIKLRYQADFTSSATVEVPISYNDGGDTFLAGWNNGAQGDGYHVIFPLVQYNIVQNNGATTFIGNDILQPFLIQNSQTPGAANFGSESSFAAANHCQPYTRDNYSLKNLLPGGSFDVSISMEADFAPLASSTSNNLYSTNSGYLAFVLFEIDKDNNPLFNTSDSTRFRKPFIIHSIPISSGLSTIDSISTAASPATMNLSHDKVYVFGMIADNDDSPFGGEAHINVRFSNLKFSIKSHYDGGVLGIPIPAPKFPPSVFLAYRTHQLLEKIIKNLPTKVTNGYGFPMPVETQFTGYSAFLSDREHEPVFDCIPYNIAMTSGYAIHDLEGQSYITVSLDQLFGFLNKQLCVGLGIEPDDAGDPNIVRLENIEYFFDSGTCILDLGLDVYDLTIEHITQGMGANLKAGYTKADTNTDFGVDAFITELYFNTPLSAVPGTMDYQETTVLCEQYAIEKVRAQKVSQPIGTSYDPANPSGDNVLAAIYLESANYRVAQVYDPTNLDFDIIANYIPKVYSNAQSTDPTAATAPYVYGLYYPDTAINLPLSPGRGLLRNGRWLRSFLDRLDDEVLTFRKTAVMQYNNKVEELSGIESNLVTGGSGRVVTEFKDLPVSSLGEPLFRPYHIRFKSRYPVNMYQIINQNPRGYIQCTVRQKDGSYKIYKGWLNKVKQNIGSQAATEFELLMCPDVEF